MYRVSKQLSFSAAHQVRLSADQCEAMHGHNYRLVVHAEAHELDAIGYVLDFGALKSAASEAAARFDHRNINEVEPFTDGGRNPTAEELARFFAEELGKRLDDSRVRISKVEVFETDNNRAEYCP
ncbi:MAG TPA: 6-carboxytetrahydropterin synthase [Myxococcales bacterium]|jgi:6-pyruvoyltetrahydropterin/6-carboxytetrahydropterin synthase|nr:6-carboxytetrahydropterin synthase [Myxococcales bacterium]